MRVIAVIVAVLAVGLGASSASARRTSASAGTAVYGSTESCMGWDITSGTAGVALVQSATCTSFLIPPAWMMPLILDSTGAKTVSVTARITAASQVQCYGIEYNASGTMTQLIVFPAFSVGGYSVSSKALTVAAGASFDVVCTYNESDSKIGDARLLSFEY